MMQIVHNNFTDGIRKVGFRYTADGAFFIDIYEGEAIFRLRCGFGGKRYSSDINMHGENYKVTVKSFFTRDEYNHLVIRNEIFFLEEACQRIFNIYFKDETFIHPLAPSRIEIRIRETPGTDMFFSTLRNLNPEGAGFESAILSKVVKGGVKEALMHAITATIQPVIGAVLTNPEFVMPTDDGADTAAGDEEEDTAPPADEELQGSDD